MTEAVNRFLFEYRHEGAEWALEIQARDLDDAKARLRTLPWAQYRGEIVSSGRIPGGGLIGQVARLFRRPVSASGPMPNGRACASEVARERSAR